MEADLCRITGVTRRGHQGRVARDGHPRRLAAAHGFALGRGASWPSLSFFLLTELRVGFCPIRQVQGNSAAAIGNLSSKGAFFQSFSKKLSTLLFRSHSRFRVYGDVEADLHSLSMFLPAFSLSSALAFAVDRLRLSLSTSPFPSP